MFVSQPSRDNPIANAGPADVRLRSGRLAALVVLHDLRVASHALEVLDQHRRDAVHEVLRYVIQRPRSQPSDQHEDFQIRHRKALVGEMLPAGCLQPRLELLEVSGDMPRSQLFACLLLGIRGQVDSLADPRTDIPSRVHHLVAQQRLPVILGVQAGHLADIAIYAVRLRNDLAVDFKRGHRQERRLVAERRPILAHDALIFERDAADVQRQTRRLAAPAVEIEISQLQLCHFQDPRGYLAVTRRAFTCTVQASIAPQPLRSGDATAGHSVLATVCYTEALADAMADSSWPDREGRHIRLISTPSGPSAHPD